MEDPNRFKVIARLLREEACRPEVSPEHAVKAKRLAEHFDTLSVDPCTKITDKRYA
jgi:hypothetical protein